uniref:SNF-related serine/threonine-protein kinase n=1 Tax=Macrostomum lignano TaxID=282301 RepID=A0A1I8H1X3_9PLAT
MAQQQQHQLQQQQHVQRHFSIDSTIAGQYDLEHTIGRGHFAVVKLAKHTFTGEQVAVKVIDKSKLDAVSREHLFQEVMCMKLVQHPNVVRLYEVIDTANRLYLILELGDGGDLYDYILKHERGLKESMAKSFFHQIVTAIAYCHKLHVCHRDLKLENCVVFEKQGLVKLTDFGFSNVFTPGKFLETSCGSLAYSAPEILLGDSYDATKVDVWSLGVILFMLATGKLPFQEQNDSETLARIMDVRYRVPRHVSLPCRRLIERLLQRDPTRRPTLDSILEDEWLCGLPTLSCGTPLVCANEVSPEDQLEVVDKMVEGGLATRDEILAALGRDDYSHVTATYYLLAERLMRRARLERHRLSIGSSGGGRPPSRGQSAELESIPETAGAAAAAGGAGGSSRQSSCASLSVEEKLRRFSMIIEEEDIGLASLAEESGAALPGAIAGSRAGSSSESSDSPSRPLSEYSLGELACGGFGCCYESPDNPGFIADAVSSDHNIGGSLAAVVCCPIRELDEPPASLEASAAVGDTESPIVSAGGAFGQVQSVSASSSARQSRRRQSDGRQCSSANARDSSFSLNSSAASSSL